MSEISKPQTSEDKKINPFVNIVVQQILDYFKNFKEDHKFDEEDYYPETFEYDPPTENLFAIQSRNNIKLTRIKIENHIKHYNIEFITESPCHALLERYHHEIGVSEYGVKPHQLYDAIEKLFKNFRRIKICSLCFNLNLTPTDDSDVCMECAIKTLLDYPKIQCSICLEETNNFITLPCDHKFHASCFTKIKCEYNKKIREVIRKCPLCRIKLYVSHKDHITSFVKVEESELKEDNDHIMGHIMGHVIDENGTREILVAVPRQTIENNDENNDKNDDENDGENDGENDDENDGENDGEMINSIIPEVISESNIQNNGIVSNTVPEVISESNIQDDKNKNHTIDTLPELK
jgi:hypothetical protein